MMDEDYYVLTLAAIARELELRRLTSARVYLAVGLPLTWGGEQKDSFRAYLLHNESVEFTFRDTGYHVEFVGADVYPQGFAAVAANLRTLPCSSSPHKAGFAGTPFGSGIPPFGRARALSEADAAPAGACENLPPAALPQR